MPTNSSGGRIHDSSVPSGTAVRHGAAEFDLVLGKLAGEVGRHLHGGEAGFAVRHRVGQRAAQDAARHRDLLDLVGVEILLELAVRDHVGPPVPPSENRPSAVITRARRRPARSTTRDSVSAPARDASRSVRARGPRMPWARAPGKHGHRARRSRTNFFTTSGVLLRVRATAQPSQAQGQNGPSLVSPPPGDRAVSVILNLGNAANTATFSTVDTLTSGAGADTIASPARSPTPASIWAPATTC